MGGRERQDTTRRGPRQPLNRDANKLVPTTYRDNYHRLVIIKNKYDPTNLFRVNQNITPTV